MLTLLGRVAIALTCLLTVVPAAAAQDDDIVRATLEDGTGRQIGRAEIHESPHNYGVYFRLMLDGGTKLRVLRPDEGARRNAPAPFSFLEYRVDPQNPGASNEVIGRGTATVDPSVNDRNGVVASFSGSMQLTSRFAGDNEVPVTEPRLRFKLVIQ